MTKGRIKLKARIKTLTILIAICVISLISGIFAGCIGEQNAKQKADGYGMTACVTYYTNGGNFRMGTSSDNQKAYRTDYYKPNTPIFNIGVDKTVGQSLSIIRKGYVFAGWEYAKLDSNGFPLLYEVDSNGVRTTGEPLTVLDNGTASIIGSTGREMSEDEKRFEAVPSGEKVFENGHPKVGAGEHKYLVATWVKDVALEYRVITDAPISVTIEVDAKDEEDKDSEYTVDADGKIFKNVTYNNGDVISSANFLNGDTITLYPDKAPLHEDEKTTFKDRFSYINLYWDKDGTQAVVEGDFVTKSKDETNSVVYAKYLSGNWTAVRNGDGVAGMLEATGNKNYYVVYDIDCTGVEFSYKTFGNFGGTIEGNGKKLSHINIDYIVKNGDVGSMFGNLTATAKIKDLTLEDVTITLNLSFGANATAHVLVSGIATGAVLENFLVDTVTFKITIPDNSKLYNIQFVGGSYKTDNWLYGNGTNATDEQFESVYGKIVQNGTLIINDEEIVTGGQL